MAGLLAVSLALGGCAAGAASDATQVVGAVAQLQAADGRRICLDRTTRGEPLAIFRTMLPAPNPARRPLGWRTPGPLMPSASITNRQLVADEFRDQHVVLPEHGQTAPELAFEAQWQLNGLARRMANVAGDKDVAIPDGAKVQPRWWIRNRLDPGCDMPYTISNPVLAQNIAFVSVTAGHQGTIYAVQRDKGVWKPIAKWSNWLY